MKLLFVVLACLGTSAQAIAMESGAGGWTFRYAQELQVLVLQHAVRTGHLPTTEEGLNAVTQSDGTALPYPMLQDSFDEPYVYRAPSRSPERLFDLYSKGPNKTDDLGGGDDIVPWEYRDYDHRNVSMFWIYALLAVLALDGPVLLVLWGAIFVRNRVQAQQGVPRRR